jgi:hypothetical protein
MTKKICMNRGERKNFSLQQSKRRFVAKPEINVGSLSDMLNVLNVYTDLGTIQIGKIKEWANGIISENKTLKVKIDQND